MKLRHLLTSLIIAANATHAAHAAASADTYPVRPLRMVVGFPAGGPVDLIGRVLSPALSADLGQQIVVENRVGANAIIGTDLVAKAQPDGHTFLFASPGSTTISPALYPKLPYDTLRDLAPVIHVTDTPEVLVVFPGTGLHSVKELVALARAKPDTLNFASSGSGGLPHLAQELFKSSAKISMLHVPYGGGAPAVAAVLGGQMHGMFADLPVVLPHIRAGRLTALTVTASRRAPALPDVPATAEAGYPDVLAINWYGVFLPAHTPAARLARLHRAFSSVLADNAMHDKLAGYGADPVGGSPEAFAAFVRDDLARWSKVARSANVKID